jgi:hypothetical protein
MLSTIDISTEDLPLWMRQARRRRDWGLILALILGLLAAWPYVVRPGLPRTNASENYVYLAADYADALREGRLYPRWSPHTLSGYGAPIPHFFPPGAPYTAGMIKVLFTNDTVRAVRIVFILGFCIGAAATYRLVRRQTGAASGLIAVTLFAFSPYFGYTLPYVRGELAEFLGCALLPLSLWALDRVLVTQRPTDILGAALATAALLLTFPPMLLAAGILAVTLSLYHQLHNHRSAWRSVAAVFGLSMALTAFYWLPAWREADLVRWIEPALVFRVDPAQLLAPLPSLDLNQFIPQPVFTVGTITLPLLLLAAGIVIRLRTGSFHLLCVGISILLLAGILIWPTAVWLLGPLNLSTACSSGAFINLISPVSLRQRRLALAALFTFTLIGALPALRTPWWPGVFGSVQPIDQITYEQQGAGIAVLPPTYPLPLTLPGIPPINRLLISSYEANNINKIMLSQSSSRAQVNLIVHGTHYERYQVQTSTSIPATVLTAFFPGWQILTSTTSVSLTPNQHTGLIDILIPPMSGELLIILGSTPIRQAAWAISAAALIGISLSTLRQLRRSSPHFEEINTLTTPELRLLSFIVGAFAIIVILNNLASFPRIFYDPPGHGLQKTETLRRGSNAGLEALAYTLKPTEVTPGDTLQVTLYWQALRPLPANYVTHIQLRHKDTGTIWFTSPNRSPGHYPTSRWRSYLYVRDEYLIPISSAIPPGEYEVTVEALDCNPVCSDASRLIFFDMREQTASSTLILPTQVIVSR